MAVFVIKHGQTQFYGSVLSDLLPNLMAKRHILQVFAPVEPQDASMVSIGDFMKNKGVFLSAMLLALVSCGGTNGDSSMSVSSAIESSNDPFEVSSTEKFEGYKKHSFEAIDESHYHIEKSAVLDANDNSFNPIKNIESSSVLNNKNIYWLGSSVTYGAESQGIAMPEYMEHYTGCNSFKSAVSGTTLYDDGSSVAMTGTKSYVRRLLNCDEFKGDRDVSAFVCQISTNDAQSQRISNIGTITTDSFDKDSFDVSKTLGAIEFIIAYVTETWHCPVFFYSGAFFSNVGIRKTNNPKASDYADLVEYVYDIAEKWNSNNKAEVHIIDMFNDEGFNKLVDDDYYQWAIKDPIHPKKAGYLQWWTPYIKDQMENVFVK